MEYIYNREYEFYVKPIEEIKQLSPRIAGPDQKRSTMLIFHSSGKGGGLRLTYKFIKKYCGTDIKLNVRFIRKTLDRHMFQFSKQYENMGGSECIYLEWLITELPIKIFLENDLFEI